MTTSAASSTSSTTGRERRTEAWVLRKGARGKSASGTLELATIPLSSVGDHDVLAEPLYGSWEANMTHALERDPVDVCRLRREEEVVLGNSGVLRVLETGTAVTGCRVGDLCGFIPNGAVDRFGHTVKVCAYDAPGTMGMLAKQVVLHEDNLGVLPINSRHSLQQWAAFAIRYCTAWDNWHLAHRVWRAQFDGEPPTTHVWGWGGGVSFAELQLARDAGCGVAMMASSDARIDQLKQYESPRSTDAIFQSWNLIRNNIMAIVLIGAGILPPKRRLPVPWKNIPAEKGYRSLSITLEHRFFGPLCGRLDV